jgi:hypothetical protein
MTEREQMVDSRPGEAGLLEFVSVLYILVSLIGGCAMMLNSNLATLVRWLGLGVLVSGLLIGAAGCCLAVITRNIYYMRWRAFGEAKDQPGNTLTITRAISRLFLGK